VICKPRTHFQIFLLAVQIYNAKYLQQESGPLCCFDIENMRFLSARPHCCSQYIEQVYICVMEVLEEAAIASIYSCLFELIFTLINGMVSAS